MDEKGEKDEFDVLDAPMPKPRTVGLLVNSPSVPPLPQPRNRLVHNDRVTSSNILRSISTVSKQITDDVTAKVTSSAKTANDKFEKSLSEGSKFARGTIKKTINTTREVRDNITKSVIEGTMSIKFRKPKNNEISSEGLERSASMPPPNLNLFENINFFSPLYESSDKVKYSNFPAKKNQHDYFDNNSYRSSYCADSDSVSNGSFDSKDCDQSIASSSSGQDHLTYDTPKFILQKNYMDNNLRSIVTISVGNEKLNSSGVITRIKYKMDEKGEKDEFDVLDAPMPKPRTVGLLVNSPSVPPLPQPRNRLVHNDRVTSSNILRSISTVSKQITDDVTAKVTSSAKTANDKFEKSLSEGSKFARGTIKKTINTTREVRDNITKSVIEGTMSIKFRKPKNNEISSEGLERSASMPPPNLNLFENINFFSPLYESSDKVKYSNFPAKKNQHDYFDNNSYRSSYCADSDSVSNGSFDSKDCDQSIASSSSGQDHLTYDTPKFILQKNYMDPAKYLRNMQAPENKIVEGTPTGYEMQEAETRAHSLRVQKEKQTIYENWNLPFSTKPTPNEISTEAHPTSRPSTSTIFEFDPLKEKMCTLEGKSNELLLLQSFLVEEAHGEVEDECSQEIDFEFSETEYYNPPTPPERSDSLDYEDERQSVAGSISRDSNSNWYVPKCTQQIESVEVGMTKDLKPGDTIMQKFSRKLRLDGVLSKSNSTKTATTKVETVEKPLVNNLPVTHYSGILSKTVTPGMEEIFRNTHNRYCMLSDQQLICYSDPTSGIIKESYLLNNVLALQIVLPVSSSMNDSYCFELWVCHGGGKGAPRKVIFTCGSVSERRNWAQKIAEHLTVAFLPKYTAEYTRMGWCYLKEGVTGGWRSAWLMLTRRVLLYTNRDASVTLVDLRKTKCIVNQDADEEAKNLCPSETTSNLLLDCPVVTIYLRFPYERLLKDWRYMLKLAAHNNGAYIHHQQLTNDNVPVLVAKCISFIYAHGSVSEGIYRRAGAGATLAALLARFRRDAWAVQLSIGEQSEHDVAGVLKRFLRDLPETLLPRSLHNNLLATIDIADQSRRFAEYRRLMSSLPLVARNTARKLFAHLHFIHTMSHANKMNAENLASVWAPTIMPPAMTSNVVQTAWSNKEVFVVRDLIANYEAIWEPTEMEKKRETTVRQVLMRVLSNSAPTEPKAAGDLKVWIYIKDKSTCHQVALSPSKTAEDVCVELCDKANMESHLLMIEEVICGDSMRRIVHIDEILLDVVLRWGYWDEEDRKDSYLVLKENVILHEIEALRNNNSLVCGELKVATESSKAFKQHMFEFQNGCLCYFKDKQGSHKIEEWNIKNIFWYVGHEPKRNPQSRWAITFIPRNKQKRSKEKPWFGCTIAGAVTEDRLKWMAAMMFGEHSNILPTPRLIIT